MSGISKWDGKIISDVEHVKQSIIDICLTPRGSRVGLRRYGSDLYKLLDRAAFSTIDIAADLADALDRFEPRFTLEKVDVVRNFSEVKIIVKGRYNRTGQGLEVQVI